MSQHDYVIANGTGAAVRSDLNNALAAIVSQNSGATAPATTYAYQWWADTTAGLLKLRNAANNAWITLFQLDGEWTTLAVENGSAAAPSIYFKDSGTDTGIYSPGANQVAVATNGTGRLFVDSNGLVGIGNASPGALLDIIGSGNIVRLGDGTNTFDVRFKGPNNWTTQLDTSADKFNIQRNSTSLVTIDSAGRLGIGTTSPSHRLHVGNTADNTKLLVSSSFEAALELQNGGGSEVNVINSAGSGNLSLRVNNSEKARLDSSGRLLVGTSSASGGSNVHIQDAGGAQIALRRGEAATSITTGEFIGGINFQDSGENSYASIVIRAEANAGSSDYPGRIEFSVTQDGQASPTERQRIRNDGETYFFSNNYGLRVGLSIGAGTSRTIFHGRHSATDVTNGTDSFYVWSNGNVQNTNNSYSAISDIKLKENIVDANSQWDDIKALQVRNYNLKEGQTHTQIGLIAQEVEPISPGLVYEYPDRDEEGNDLGTVTKSVNYSVLYMKAVKALQEAMERIETLEAKVAALETP